MLWIVLALAALMRCLMMIGSPTSFGYVYDFYPAAVAYVYDHHALPPPNACWICAHPPLFWIIGAPFYALGMGISHGQRAIAERFLCIVPLACDGLTILFTYRFLRLHRQRGLLLVCGVALCAFFPCLVISSYAPESDMLLTALMVIGLFYLCRMHLRWHRQGIGDAARLGLLCGLAALTKYSGVLLLVVAASVLGTRVFRDGRRHRAVIRSAVVVGLAFAIGGAQYVYNYAVHGDLLLANGSAQSGFAVLDIEARTRNLRHYDFGVLRLRDAVALFQPDGPAGTLTDQPVYSSVWTTLHAMAWTDMSVFSVHTRHGDPELPYPSKHVPIPLVKLMLYLGLVPTLLASIGFGLAARRRTLWPLSFLTLATLATYAWWFLPQSDWALKTKYVLFLLPIYILFALLGLRRVLTLHGSFGAATATATLSLFSALIVSCLAYLARFALS